MEQTTELDKKSSDTKKDGKHKNKLNEKNRRKSPRESVLDGRNVKIVRFIKKDAERLKDKYTVTNSDTHVPIDEDFLDSVTAKTEKNMDKEVISPKVNAFQFMMNSRHKVIGSNSPGKEKKLEIEKSPEEIIQKKEKLNQRKASFEDWAEKRGGKKRKLADEAQEQHIKKVLRERAKRLKNMLDIIDEDLRNSSYDESDHDVKSTKKKMNGKSTHIKYEQSNTKDDKEKKKTKEKTKVSRSSRRKLSTDSDHSVVDIPNEENEIKNQENEKQTLLSRPKRNRKSTIIDSKDLEEIVEVSKLNETSKSRIKGKQKQIVIDVTKEDGNNKDNKIDKNSNDSIEINEDVNNTIENATTKQTKKIAMQSLSLKKNKKSITPENINILNQLNDDDNEDIFPVETPMNNKKTRQLKLFQDLHPKKYEEENKQMLTPKCWKMKVRLFEKENINEEIIDIDDKLIESPKKQSVQGKISSFFGSSTSSSSTPETKKPVKLAPLFLKQPNKTTIQESEAKKKFLFSGMPDRVRKSNSNNDFSSNEIEFELFPKISHVQQRTSTNDGCFDIFWDLPDTTLLGFKKQIENFNPTIFETFTYGTLTDCSQSEIIKRVCKPPLKLSNLKQYIIDLKKKNSNYPIFKTFRLLYEKHMRAMNKIESMEIVDLNSSKTESVKKRRGRPKKTKTNTPQKQATTMIVETQMWTEKYKPLCDADVIGNYASVKQLKSWLQAWVVFSGDQKATKKRKRANSSSDDFCTDSDTRHTNDYSLPPNMLMLVGPLGTGKTASVYALCNELNINVIEINASSKRPGKRILTELQEATQSHQVKNTDSKTVNSLFQKKTNTTNSIAEEEQKTLSLLLMEDVDVVFDDQDDGFISALTTLVASSKRPIILTTSDRNCVHLQKMLSQHDAIDFVPVSCRIASPWLQILCLIEGVCTDRNMIDRLLHWNNGDIRKTMLHLQFWVQTGGDSNCLPQIENETLESTKNQLDIHNGSNDESSNLSWFHSENNTNILESETPNAHRSCVECFTPLYAKDKTGFQLSFPINLGCIWWNIPTILNIDSIKHAEIFKSECSENATNLLSDTDISNSDKESEFILSKSSRSQSSNKSTISDLQIVVDFLESLVVTDTMHAKLKQDYCDFEPAFNYWQLKPINSLLLIENYQMYNETNNLSYEMSQWLVENNIQRCNKFRSSEKDCDINVAVPNSDEARWRIKIHKSMEDVSNIIPSYCLLDRIGVCKDYIPFMRTICRVENSRLANNNKRKNRFYHYFKTFNIHLSDSTHLVLCNSLANIND